MKSPRKQIEGVRRTFIRTVDYSSVLESLIDAIWYQTTLLEEMIEMAKNNFDRLSAAVSAVADRVDEVAAAIRNPAVDNNDQNVIDDLAGRLEAASDALDTAVSDENAEDAGTSGTTPAPADGGTDTTDTGATDTPAA